MSILKRFFPDIAIINGVEFDAQFNVSEKRVTLKNQGISIKRKDIFLRKLKNGNHESLVVDSFQENRAIGTIPETIVINFNYEDEIVKEKESFSHINITHSSGIQIGDNNMQEIKNTTFLEIVEKIEKSNNIEAKKSLMDFLNNSSVANIIGNVSKIALDLISK